MPGRLRSRITRSTASVASSSRAVSPFPAERTSYPRPRRLVCTARRICGSSSTTRTRSPIRPPLAPGAGPAPGARGGLMGLRVLVVDDDPQIRRAVQTSLRGRGYEVRSAGNGETALEELATEAVDLVILDLSLPGMDGHEVMRRLRAFSEVPVLVLSVRESQDDKIAALDAGADDYVTKPFSIGELLARMRAVERRSH